MHLSDKPYDKPIDKLAERIKSCDWCRLSGGRPVAGEGNPRAQIMFIGEAPGRQEELAGRPFIGAAGRLLNQLLHDIGLERDEVYITNVIKCRPPENRDPLPEEIEACRPWLDEQIRLVRPRLIVLLGKHALGRFLPGLKISNVHGRPQQAEVPGLGSIVFFPVYHPASALYNKGMRTPLEEDFRKIPDLLRSIVAGRWPS
ncbi:MAG: uracil-DNA glycosylase [bacterium]|nr:uracil-DNA glycosylase [bacterium]